MSEEQIARPENRPWVPGEPPPGSGPTRCVTSPVHLDSVNPLHGETDHMDPTLTGQKLEGADLT